MKIKINQRLNEDDSLQDVVQDFDKPTAVEAKKTEDALGGNFKIESEPWADKAKGDLEAALTASLLESERIKDELEVDLEELTEEGREDEFDPTAYGFASNVLIVGPAGTGKTARVKSWCKENGIELIYKDAKGMDPTDLSGIISRYVDEHGQQTNMAIKLRNTEFDVLDTPNTILFLDELNRAPKDVAGSILTLIQDHVVPSNEGSGYKFLSGFLFSVAAINPAEQYDDTNELDMAMKTRHAIVSVAYDNMQSLEYFRKKFGRLIENPRRKLENRIMNYNRYQIAKKLLTNPEFHFDTEAEEAELGGSKDVALNYRSLDKLLSNCDGTKEDFLTKWPRFCNPHKLNQVELMLDDYFDYELGDDLVDIDDRANSVFQQQPQVSAWSKIQNALGDD